jgi:hypothetical protein
MPRQTLIALAAGLCAAVLYLSTGWSLFGALVLAMVAPLPLMATGLGLGLASALLASAAALALVAAGAGFARAGLFAAADVVPALIVVRFALLSRQDAGGATHWYPPGHILVWLTLYCAAAFVVLATVAGTGPDGLEAGISAYIDGFRQMLADSGRNGPAVDHMFTSLARVFPFLVTAWWIVIVAVNAALAQKLLVRRGLEIRPSPDLAMTTPPFLLLPAMVAATVAALLGSGWFGFVATNVALILCVPYFLTGLAVIHAISRGWNGRTAILVALYLLLLLFRWPLIAIAGLGMVEYWIGLRRRYGAPDQGKERNE